MTGLGELFLAKFVKNIELNGKGLIVTITDRGQLDLHDDSTIGHHHSYTSKEYLQVLGELLTTSITGIHGNEITNLRLQGDHTFIRELELLQLSSLGNGDGLNHSCYDRKSWETDTVELIEATPKSGHTETLEDL
jgi:hypothetical protein